MGLSRTEVAAGYAALMSRYPLPVFYTQSFANRQHPESVVKAQEYALVLMNNDLHGKRWRRQGIVGCQSVYAIERHKSGWPHSHAVIGHPDMDLASASMTPFRNRMRESFFQEWGIAKVDAAQSLEAVNQYVSKYICKDGDIYFSKKLERISAQSNLELRRA